MMQDCSGFYEGTEIWLKHRPYLKQVSVMRKNSHLHDYILLHSYVLSTCCMPVGTGLGVRTKPHPQGMDEHTILLAGTVIHSVIMQLMQITNAS